MCGEATREAKALREKKKELNKKKKGVCAQMEYFSSKPRLAGGVTVNDNIVKYSGVLLAASYLFIYALSPAAGT